MAHVYYVLDVYSLLNQIVLARMGENWIVLVAFEVGATGTASVDSSVASVTIGVVIVEFCVIFGMFIGIVGVMLTSGNLLGGSSAHCL